MAVQDSSDSGTGVSKAGSATTSQFVTALVIACITVGVCAIFWFIFHKRKALKHVFEPRVELAAADKRPRELPDGTVSWWRTVFSYGDDEVLRVNGPDAYFFVRFLKIFGLYMMVPYILLAFAACVPSSAIKPNNNLGGVNTLTFGNVPDNAPLRRLPHFIICIILMLGTVFLIWKEYHHFMDVRTQWLKLNPLSLKSRTVVMVNVPEDMCSESTIRELASGVAGTSNPLPPRTSGATDGTAVHNKAPGGVTHVWIAQKVGDLEKVHEKRDKECVRLEGGVGKLLKKALKNEKKGKTPEKKGTWSPESSGSMVDRYVLPKKQPTWKQGLLGLIGKKMDLDSSPVWIHEQNEEVEKLRAAADYKQGNVAFVRFVTQSQAHNFARTVKTSDKSLRMLQTGIEVLPEDIVWSNVGVSAVQRKARGAVSWALTIGLIIIWAIPVAIVGAISNIDAIKTQSGFTWIAKIPSVPLGIIKTVLPVALLAVLFMLLPIILRLWIKLSGEVRNSEIDLKLFTRYWLFWIIHGFLIVTLSAGLINALGNLGDTASSVPTLLASKLPGASVFFLTWILTATWGAGAKLLARIIPFVKYQLRFILAGGTPRKAFAQKYQMDSFNWATTWPNISLILAVTIVYSVIQPLITIIGMVGCLLFYMAYKYVLIWTASQDPEAETGGLYYIKALRTVFVALYLQGICMAGLFFLSSGPDGKRTKSGLACGAIIAAVIGLIALVQIYIDWVVFKKDTLRYGWTQPNGHSDSDERLNKLAEKRSAHSEMPDQNMLAEENDHEGRNQFNHPATWKKQPVVWIADDPLGLGQLQADRINAHRVEASTQFAHMNDKAEVWVDRGPPDEDWEGGV